MKFASFLLFVAVVVSGTAALPVPEAPTCPPETTTAAATTTTPEPSTTTTTTTTTTTLETAPAVPLSTYQQPITLPNTTNPLLSASLVMTVDESRPDTPLPRVRQIGPNAYVSIPFDASHAGKRCRIHFAISNLADGGNGVGTEDVYRVSAGGGVDVGVTFNRRPVVDELPIASFGMAKSVVSGVPPVELYPAVRREDFVCPGEPTGFEVRGGGGAVYNWSWNKGVVVEVLEGGVWWDDGNGGVY